MARHFTKLLLTGACGALGTVLRPTLAAMCDELLCVDIKDAPTDLAANETYVRADMANMDAVLPLLDGVEMALHFASHVDEAPFEDLLGPNFIAAYNLWEAAHRHGTRRIVYASSVHAVGMYPSAQGIDLDAAHRPDTFYGLAKCFTEDLARMYWEKRGLECVSLRIFSCQKEPANVRALGTWLSFGDLRRLVTCAVEAHTVGYADIFGISANTRAPVRNDKAAFLGYVPRDNAEDWADALFASAGPADPQDVGQMRLGGPFASIPLGESGIAAIKRMGKP